MPPKSPNEIQNKIIIHNFSYKSKITVRQICVENMGLPIIPVNGLKCQCNIIHSSKIYEALAQNIMPMHNAPKRLCV